MPTIVLMNPEDAGSLLKVPQTVLEQEEAAFWKANAVVHVMSTYKNMNDKNKEKS